MNVTREDLPKMLMFYSWCDRGDGEDPKWSIEESNRRLSFLIREEYRGLKHVNWRWANLISFRL